MNICADDHDEIVFAGRLCPMCELIRNHETEVAELRRAIMDAANGPGGYS